MLGSRDPGGRQWDSRYRVGRSGQSSRIGGDGRVNQVPVVAVTGYLGAGKTSLLNHVLRNPGARIGVVVNDFGDVNIDAGLVSGQIDEPASITGGCVCCLPDDGVLDDALARLSRPSLRLDAILVEASGLADPLALARMIRFSGVSRVRPGGVIEVVDALAHFETVDLGDRAPERYRAVTMVVANKVDELPPRERRTRVERLRQRVHECNPSAQIVPAVAGRIDPKLVYDVDGPVDLAQPLPLGEQPFAARDGGDAHPYDHEHADAITARSAGCIDPGRLVDLLEDPPNGVYRIKGNVSVRVRSGVRGYVVNLVGRSIHIAADGRRQEANTLVAIGAHLESARVRELLGLVLAPNTAMPSGSSFRRLQRHRQLSL